MLVKLTMIAAMMTGGASAPPVTDPHVIVHFDLNQLQQPENIALEPDGAVDLTFSPAAQVARVTPNGQVRVIAQLPLSTRGKCPIVPFNTSISGLVRDHRGTLYANLCTGTDDQHGLWRVTPGHAPVRIAALPPNGFPNGLALDDATGTFYVADSALGVIWRIHDGTPTVWASGPELAPNGFIGANGIKIHDNAIWVTNTDRGTLLRIPVLRDGSAGPIQVKATDLGGVDDFAFAGDTVFAALNEQNQVAIIYPDGSHDVVLDEHDGLSNPTAIAVCGNTVYVPDAAYLTQRDPNLLTARINVHSGR